MGAVSFYQQALANCSNSYHIFSLTSRYEQLPNSRLCRTSDGTLGIVAKTPAELFGERVLRPILDKTIDWSTYTFNVIKNGFFQVDQAISRSILRVLPVVQAANLKTEKCLAPHLDLVVQVTNAGVAKNDHQMLLAAHTLFSPLIEQCFMDEQYEITTQQYKAAQELHEQMLNEREKALEECRNSMKLQSYDGNYYCISELPLERKPEIFQTGSKSPLNGQALSKTWEVSQGYLFWRVNIYRYLWWNQAYRTGGYNYDINAKGPTVMSREEIIKQHK